MISLDCDVLRLNRLDMVSCLILIPLGTECRLLIMVIGSKVITVFCKFRQGVGCEHYEGEKISDSEVHEGSTLGSSKGS